MKYHIETKLTFLKVESLGLINETVWAERKKIAVTQYIIFSKTFDEIIQKGLRNKRYLNIFSKYYWIQDLKYTIQINYYQLSRFINTEDTLLILMYKLLLCIYSYIAINNHAILILGNFIATNNLNPIYICDPNLKFWLCLYATQCQNFDFNLTRDHQNNFPMNVGTMSR